MNIDQSTESVANGVATAILREQIEADAKLDARIAELEQHMIDFARRKGIPDVEILAMLRGKGAQ